MSQIQTNARPLYSKHSTTFWEQQGPLLSVVSQRPWILPHLQDGPSRVSLGANLLCLTRRGMSLLVTFIGIVPWPPCPGVWQDQQEDGERTW